MAELVNLRTVRKQRRRSEARDRTEAAAPSGDAAADGRLRHAEQLLERRRHEGHRIAPKDGESDPS